MWVIQLPLERVPRHAAFLNEILVGWKSRAGLIQNPQGAPPFHSLHEWHLWLRWARSNWYFVEWLRSKLANICRETYQGYYQDRSDRLWWYLWTLASKMK
ncbi:hypothetical protein PM082_013377 [Marasmius tenuissimus]|nr:hypothetical protein PM082_013377 [Marasmius tenuissimus]